MFHDSLGEIDMPSASVPGVLDSPLHPDLLVPGQEDNSEVCESVKSVVVV